jgi:hypothetical protein
MDKKKLYLKGHSVEHIARADIHLRRAEKAKHPHVRKLEEGMFWSTLATGIIGSAILSFAIIPVLSAGTALQGLLVSFVFGFLIGLLITYISGNMSWLEKKQHLTITFTIPAIALVNFFIVAFKVNNFNARVGLYPHQEPIMIGLIYMCGFFAAYAVMRTTRVKKWVGA